MLPVFISVRSNIYHSKVSKLYLLCGKKYTTKKQRKAVLSPVRS